MSRDQTRTRSRGHTDGAFGSEFGMDDEESESVAGADADGLRKRTAERATRVFSPRVFIAALLVTVAGLFAASTFVPLPGAGLLGVFVGAFLLGLAIHERRYVETALAGGIAAAVSTLLDFAVVAFLGGFGVSLAVIAGGLGAVVGVAGAYFGRDLRNGLTKEI